MALNIVFAGTPEFAVPSLDALIHSEHSVCAVYTQPDRPAGRGQKIQFSPVKQQALAHRIPVFQPTTLKDSEALKQLADLKPDVMIVVAYGLILPQAVLDIPLYGCINVHASLLPRWRGAAPIHYAILEGDAQTGITTMQMDAGLDTGDILHQVTTPIKPTDSTASLLPHLAHIGGKVLIDTLSAALNKRLSPLKQDEALATYAPKISKHAAQIDWRESASTIERKIRAFNPWPVATANINGHTVRLFQSRVIDEQITAPPGTVLSADHPKGLCLATGQGILRLLSIQLPGKKVVSVDDFLNAHQDFFN